MVYPKSVRTIGGIWIALSCVTGMAGLHGEEARIVRSDQAEATAKSEELAEVTNRLGLGAHADAVHQFLGYAGRHADRIVFGDVEANQRNGVYDRYERWKLGPLGLRTDAQRGYPEDLILFFKEDCLVRKCIVPRNDQAGHLMIYRREILSGRQYPPADKRLMDAVKWGEATSPDEGLRRRERDQAATVRCGIVMDARTAFARKYGYNVLVLVQNASDVRLDDELAAIFFGSDTFFVYGSRDSVEDDLLSSLPWSASATRTVSGVVPAILEAAPELRKLVEGDGLREPLGDVAVPVVPFRLEPGQYIYAWMKIDLPDDYDALEARMSAIGLLRGIREWRARSRKLAISPQFRR